MSACVCVSVCCVRAFFAEANGDNYFDGLLAACLRVRVRACACGGGSRLLESLEIQNSRNSRNSKNSRNSRNSTKFYKILQ